MVNVKEQRLDWLETPAVTVDLDILEANLRRKAELARQGGVKLRPHIKTHKSVEIARPYMTGKRADMGRTAVIECGNLMLVVTEKRNAPWDLGHVRSIGLWPGDFHVIVVKSAIAWRTAFGNLAKKVINVESPGACTSNLRLLNYTKLKRPIYPLD
jgi:microcystin degradation protein MlrC